MNTQISPTSNLMSLFLENGTRLLDMQLCATRSLLEANAKNLAIFGLPDVSAAFRTSNGNGEETTDQLRSGAHQFAKSYNEMQNHWNRMVQKQAEQWSENLRQGMRDMTIFMQEGLRDATETAKRAVSEVDERLQQASKEQSAEVNKQFEQSFIRGQKRGDSEPKSGGAGAG